MVSNVRLTLLIFLSLCAQVQALEGMTDNQMSAVNGRDGLTVSLDNIGPANPIGVDSLRWVNDAGTAEESALLLNNVALSSSTIAAGPPPITLDIDVGTNLVNTPVLSADLRWEELALTIGDAKLRDNAGSSTGDFGFFSSGQLQVINEGGLFNGSSDNAYFKLAFSSPVAGSQGDFIMRRGGPGSPEFSFGNANLLLETLDCANSTCRLGINNDGLYLSADKLGLDLNFELLFKNNPTNPNGFDRTGREEMIRMGWAGTLNNFYMGVGSGAIAGSQGLAIDTSFDFANNFAFTLGQAGTNNTRARFHDFQSLPSADAKQFSLPLDIDVVPAGQQRFGDLCFGDNPACSAGTVIPQRFVNVDALAVKIRDGHLNAFNTKVDVIDVGAGTTETYDWSLGYTFGRLDSNIALYQGLNFGGGTGLDSTGITADVTLAINSPGFWDKLQNESSGLGDDWAQNTHFFLADTNTSIDIDGDGSAGDIYAFGLLNADLLWNADDLAVRVAGDGDVSYGVPFGGGLRLQSYKNVRYQFRGILGGAPVSDLSDTVSIAIADVRIDADQFVFALTPGGIHNGAASVGFEGMLDLNQDSYISLAEPSSPSAEFGIRDVSGRVLWRDGYIQVASGENLPNNEAALTIANEIAIGRTAGGESLRGQITTAGENVAEFAIPTGIFYSKIQLGPQ